MPREASPPPPLDLSPFQQTTLVLLRTLIGWHFLYEGYYKLSLPAWSPSGQPLAPFSAAGYIRGSSGPLTGLAQWAVESGLLPWIDKLVVFGLLAVGFSLMLGLLTRIGCIGGMALLAMFYLTGIPMTGLPQTGAEGTYLLVNKTLIEGMAVLALYAFDTGRIAGLDRLWATAQQRRAVAQPATQGSGS